MNNNFLHHFLEKHWLIDIYIQEQEEYLQDKICAYAHEVNTTWHAIAIWTWQECEDARESSPYDGFIIREATQSEKDFYATRSI